MFCWIHWRAAIWSLRPCKSSRSGQRHSKSEMMEIAAQWLSKQIQSCNSLQCSEDFFSAYICYMCCFAFFQKCSSSVSSWQCAWHIQLARIPWHCASIGRKDLWHWRLKKAKPGHLLERLSTNQLQINRLFESFRCRHVPWMCFVCTPNPVREETDSADSWWPPPPHPLEGPGKQEKTKENVTWYRPRVPNSFTQ